MENPKDQLGSALDLLDEICLHESQKQSLPGEDLRRLSRARTIVSAEHLNLVLSEKMTNGSQVADYIDGITNGGAAGHILGAAGSVYGGRVQVYPARQAAIDYAVRAVAAGEPTPVLELADKFLKFLKPDSV